MCIGAPFTYKLYKQHVASLSGTQNGIFALPIPRANALSMRFSLLYIHELVFFIDRSFILYLDCLHNLYCSSEPIDVESFWHLLHRTYLYFSSMRIVSDINFFMSRLLALKWPCFPPPTEKSLALLPSPPFFVPPSVQMLSPLCMTKCTRTGKNYSKDAREFDFDILLTSK